MDRRDFNRIITGTLGWILTPNLSKLTTLENRPKLSVDKTKVEKHLKRLSQIGERKGGVTRLAYTEEDIRARRYIRKLMKEVGLSVSTDSAGNIIGRLEGQESNVSSLVTGSHIDTVPDGGNYDGMVGVVAAIEAARSLNLSDYQTQHPIEIYVFANEEGGKTGSKAVSGEITKKALSMKTYSGHSIWDGIKRIGGDPDNIENAKRDPSSIKAFIELHIEQGEVLQVENKTIGIVEGIVGIKRWRVTIHGEANHAGTTPMGERKDALLASSHFVEIVNEVISNESGTHVGTVGKLQVFPNAPNVIPGKVVLTLEIRDLSMDKIDSLYEKIESRAKKLSNISGCKLSFKHIYTTQSAICNQKIMQSIRAASNSLGLSHMDIPSGAGHDAQSIALIAPIGMIFVPSKDGVSHSPNEFTEVNDIVSGGNVLLDSLWELDQSNI